jgi:hypothetical protein
MAVQRLTAAYRSRPRPSSTPGAKASAMCPYYLDGELRPAPEGTKRCELPYEPLVASGSKLFGLCAVFKLRRGGERKVFPPTVSGN